MRSLRRRLRRHAHDVVEHLPLPCDFRAGPPFELPEPLVDADQVRAPLHFQVAIELREAERQLLLLPLLALLDQLAPPAASARRSRFMFDAFTGAAVVRAARISSRSVDSSAARAGRQSPSADVATGAPASPRARPAVPAAPSTRW